ncbi:hypothetical protein A2Y99_01380 [Candidatus Gottesmanbacteria bacterium RBG_13_37_7]|uniref:Uncharacterized protein n=1 Tax=Candidatus Gottesmanbacteria bacterium RBG_13_37_7 TaxID=1798369 RepID=A0A1F5YIP4_9BACT|nr:MAG: hypothetical protein A2Y99_01380 [Candidatus Gottesmanbacteria bacterium RBG_13_37_7]
MPFGSGGISFESPRPTPPTELRIEHKKALCARTSSGGCDWLLQIAETDKPVQRYCRATPQEGSDLSFTPCGVPLEDRDDGLRQAASYLMSHLPS